MSTSYHIVGAQQSIAESVKDELICIKMEWSAGHIGYTVDKDIGYQFK